MQIISIIVMFSASVFSISAAPVTNSIYCSHKNATVPADVPEYLVQAIATGINQCDFSERFETALSHCAFANTQGGLACALCETGYVADSNCGRMIMTTSQINACTICRIPEVPVVINIPAINGTANGTDITNNDVQQSDAKTTTVTLLSAVSIVLALLV
jgi:hypothetical protein